MYPPWSRDGYIYTQAIGLVRLEKLRTANPDRANLLPPLFACTMRHLHPRRVMDESEFQSPVRIDARPHPDVSGR